MAYSVQKGGLVLQDARSGPARHAEGDPHLLSDKHHTIALGLGTICLVTGAHVHKGKPARTADRIGSYLEGGTEGTRKHHLWTLHFHLCLTWQKFTVPCLLNTALSSLLSTKLLGSLSTKSVQDCRSSGVCMPLSAKSTLNPRCPTVLAATLCLASKAWLREAYSTKAYPLFLPVRALCTTKHLSTSPKASKRYLSSVFWKSKGRFPTNRSESG